MKKYSEFIKSDLNEGFFSNIFKGIGSFMRGDKDKISEYVDRMVEIEKDFINKSDELNYNVFLGDYKTTTDPSFTVNAKQKAIMSKRAIESIKLAKDSEINLLSKKISEIFNKNSKLVEFYHAKKTEADSIIAKYAYEKAKRFKDQEYEREFYNQWKELESENIKTKEFFTSYKKGEDYWEERNDVLDLGIFDYTSERFKEYISMLPSGDLNRMLDDARAIKLDLEERIQKISFILKSKRYPKFDVDDGSHHSFRQKNEETKEIYRVKIATINNKISILKDKLKYK
jgi:hypothetical protein